MKKILVLFIAALVAIPAYAATINGHSLDLDTATIGASGNSSSWQKRYSASADDGEITLAIYYHNSSNEVLNSLRVAVDKKNSGPLKNHEFEVKLSAGNARNEVSSAVVDFSDPVILEFSDVRWAPNQCLGCSERLLDGQDDEKIFEPRGILLGDIQPGWEEQGNVLVTYKVKRVPSTSGTKVEELTGGCLAMSTNINLGGVDSVDYWIQYKKGDYGITRYTDVKEATSNKEVSEVVCNIDEGEKVSYEFKLRYNKTNEILSTQNRVHNYSEKPIYTFEEESLCQPYLTEYMQVGHENAIEVRKLQNFLNDYEGESLEVTGIFEGYTFEAVKRYQEKYRSEILDPWGISEPSGFVYKTTLFHINRQVCGESRQTQCPAFSDYQQIGDSGSEVSKIQTFLKTRNYFSGEVSGYFDLNTANAISRFQEEFSGKILEPWGLTSGTGQWYKTTRRYANWLEGCVDDVLIPGEEPEVEEQTESTSTEEIDNTVKFNTVLSQEDPEECSSWECFRETYSGSDKHVNLTLDVERDFEYEGYNYTLEFPLYLSIGDAEVNIKSGRDVTFLKDGKVSTTDDDINLYYYKGDFKRGEFTINIDESDQEYIADIQEDGQEAYDTGSKQRQLSEEELNQFNEMVELRELHLVDLRGAEYIDSLIDTFEINGEEFSDSFNCYLPAEESEFRSWRFDMSKGKRDQIFEDADKIDLSVFAYTDLEYNGKTLCYPSDETDEVQKGTFLNIDPEMGLQIDLAELVKVAEDLEQKVEGEEEEEENERDFDLDIEYEDLDGRGCKDWSCLLLRAFDQKDVIAEFNIEKEVMYGEDKFKAEIPVEFKVNNLSVRADINTDQTVYYSLGGEKERLNSVQDIDLYEYTGNIFKEKIKFSTSEEDTLFIEEALENGYYTKEGSTSTIEIDSDQDDGYFDSLIQSVANKLNELETTNAGEEIFTGADSFTCYIAKDNLGMNQWEKDVLALNPYNRFIEDETNNFAQSYIVPGQTFNGKQLCFTSGGTDTVANGTFLDGYVEPAQEVEEEVIEEEVEEVQSPDSPFNPDLI